jgi:hypothetical protein
VIVVLHRPGIEISPEPILRVLDPATRRVMHQQLRMIELLPRSARPVLISPCGVRVK